MFDEYGYDKVIYLLEIPTEDFQHNIINGLLLADLTNKHCACINPTLG